MKTRIEIKRIYDPRSKSRASNPILIKPSGSEPYPPAAGACLHGPSEVCYDPNGNPRAYIEVEGRATPIAISTVDPKEDRSGRTTYVNILLETIDGNRGTKVPQRQTCPCPCLLKRKGGRTEYGHHIRINGPARIIYNRVKPIRPHVYAWIETEADVDCEIRNNCFCTGLASELWPRFCPRLKSLPSKKRARTQPCPRLPNLPSA
jgi:hypothetical protein